MLRILSIIAILSLLMTIGACNKGAEESAEGSGEAAEGNESEEGEEEEEEATPEPAGPEWLTIGELPVQASVPAGSSVTSIGTMWSVRTPTDCEFRVTPPPEQEFMAQMRTLDREMTAAERGSLGALQEVLVNEPGEATWFLGYTRDDAMNPGTSKWVLQSLVDVGGVGYTCSSISGSVDVYNCALEACRGLRAAE